MLAVAASIDQSRPFLSIILNNNANPNSNPYPSPALSADDKSFDYKSKLVKNNMAIK